MQHLQGNSDVSSEMYEHVIININLFETYTNLSAHQRNRYTSIDMTNTFQYT